MGGGGILTCLHTGLCVNYQVYKISHCLFQVNKTNGVSAQDCGRLGCDTLQFGRRAPAFIFRAEEQNGDEGGLPLPDYNTTSKRRRLTDSTIKIRPYENMKFVRALLFTQFAEVTAPRSGSEVRPLILPSDRVLHYKDDQKNSNNTHDGGYTETPSPGTSQMCCLRPNNIPQTTVTDEKQNIA
jgi:hypothetical protein